MTYSEPRPATFVGEVTELALCKSTIRTDGEKGKATPTMRAAGSKTGRSVSNGLAWMPQQGAGKSKAGGGQE